jgi:hypothetical protein
MRAMVQGGRAGHATRAMGTKKLSKKQRGGRFLEMFVSLFMSIVCGNLRRWHLLGESAPQSLRFSSTSGKLRLMDMIRSFLV